MSRPFSWITRFDLAIDGWFTPLRGNPVPDRIFAVASQLGDWSLIWHLVSTAQALRSDSDAHRAQRLVLLIVAESLIVNQGLKRVFNRSRPGERPEISDQLRLPTTSSFPSGHASAAVFATVVLAEGDPTLRAVMVPLALVVATSRVYTRLHHPSDVAVGALVGWGLGHAATALWPAPHQQSTRRRSPT